MQWQDDASDVDSPLDISKNTKITGPGANLLFQTLDYNLKHCSGYDKIDYTYVEPTITDENDNTVTIAGLEISAILVDSKYVINIKKL